jgi:hypothetical protein
MPLTLEKIAVERRTHVIKLDEVLPAEIYGGGAEGPA